MSYDISYKTLTGTKPWQIIFNKEHGFIRDDDGTKYSVLFGLEKPNGIDDRIRRLIGLKSVLHILLKKLKSLLP